MKKFLLLAGIGLAGLSANAQVIQSQNFDSFNLGNLGTQGGFDIYGGTAADYQIVTRGTGKALSIKSGATATSSSRFAWQGLINGAWATRTAGNEIFQVEFDIFTGDTMTGTAGGGVEAYSDAYAAYLGGITIDGPTKTAYALLSSGGTPAIYPLGVDAATPAVVPANSWIRVGWSFNTITGEAKFKGPGFDKTLTSVDTGTPYELDYALNSLAANNAASNTFQFDNLVAKALATSALLGTDEAAVEKVDFTIYPNPSSDVLNIKSKAKIISVYIYDASGVRSDATFNNGQVNVKHLPKGNYLLGVKTDSIYVTKKFIKN